MGRLLHRRQGKGGAAGAASLELTLVFPAVLLFLLVVLQIAFYFHAQSLARAAAAEGVRASAAAGGSATNGTVAAQLFLANMPGNLLDSEVQVTRGPGATTANVSGVARTVIPGWQLAVDVQVTAPTESA